jgi:uncharacterized SAM-binding protein YcdF (DUF218 family)
MQSVEIVLVIAILILLTGWVAFILRGRQFALRDRLQKADAIVVLAGTRGNIKFLEGKIRTAVRLYQEGWAPFIICSGKFSVKITDTPQLISLEELQAAVNAGRIQQKDVAGAAKNWDTNLGACYMRQKAEELGVPPQAILMEADSLHTRENAEFALQLAKQRNMHRLILVTSPFHQKRTYLTFAKVFQPHRLSLLNYYADTGEWHPLTWFFLAEHRKLVKSENERIKLYRQKGDLL